MRRLALLGVLVVMVAAALTAQKPDRAAPRAQNKFLPAGPFVFEPGVPRPTYMDAFGTRPVVKSPDGKLAVTVTGPKKSYEAWVTVTRSEFPDGPIQVWPIQSSVAVLWKPDSRAFALTDNRYANDSFVLIFGARLRMEDDGSGPGVSITDLTPIVRKTFEVRAQKFYARAVYDTDLIYVKALRWVGDNHLLVGLDARTLLANPPNPEDWRTMRIKEWFFGYLVDVPGKKVVRVLSEAQLLSQYGIRVAR